MAKNGVEPVSLPKHFASVIPAPDKNMHMGVVGIPVIDRYPIEPSAQIMSHVVHELAGEYADVCELCGILGRYNEAEMVAVIAAACRKGIAVCAI